MAGNNNNNNKKINLTKNIRCIVGKSDDFFSVYISSLPVAKRILLLVLVLVSIHFRISCVLSFTRSFPGFELTRFFHDACFHHFVFVICLIERIVLLVMNKNGNWKQRMNERETQIKILSCTICSIGSKAQHTKSEILNKIRPFRWN